MQSIGNPPRPVRHRPMVVDRWISPKAALAQPSRSYSIISGIDEGRVFGDEWRLEPARPVTALSRAWLFKDWVGKEAVDALGILVLDHRPTDRHHQSHRRINLLRWIQVSRRSALPTTLPEHHVSTGCHHGAAGLDQRGRRSTPSGQISSVYEQEHVLLPKARRPARRIPNAGRSRPRWRR
jgi:hypothetical protein